MPETETVPSGTNPPWRPWTPDDDQRMLSLRDQGLTARQIGRELDRSFTSVRARWQRKKLRQTDPAALKPTGHDDRGFRFRNPKWSPEDAQTFLTMLAAGATHAQIGAKLGRSVDSVRHRAKRLHKGLPVHGRTMAEAWSDRPRKTKPPSKKPRKATKTPAQTFHPTRPFVAPAVRQERVRFRDFAFSTPDLRLAADRAEYGVYLDLLDHNEPWPAAALVDLVEGLMRGDNRHVVLKRVGRAVGLPEPKVLERWRKMTLPIKNPAGVVTTHGAEVLIGLLRERLA